MTDAQSFDIRPADPAEAAALLAFGDKLLGESGFFVRLPEERARSVAEMEGILRWFRDQPDQVMLNAWDGGTAVAEAILAPGRLQRTASTGNVGIGVLQAYQGKGLGRQLMERIETQARDMGLHRLEFTVFHTNQRARRFYRKLGYRREGAKRESVRVDGHYVDEIMMAKLLG